MAISEKIVISVVDAFTSGFTNAGKQVNSLNKSLSSTANVSKLALNGLAAIGTVSATALGAAYHSASNWISGVSDLSKKTGLASESASRLLGVAQSVGLSGEDMSSAFMKMSKSSMTAYESILKANAEGKNSTDVYTKFGISITDANGNLLSSDQILKNVMEKHRSMADGVAKNAMEMEIFGKSGGNMNAMLNMSEERMARVNDVMEKAGLIVDGKTVKSFKEMNQELNLAGMVTQGLAVSVGERLIPQVKSATDFIADLTQEYGTLSDGTKDVITYTMEAVAGVGALSIGIRTATAVIGPLSAAFTNLIGILGDVKAAFDAATLSKLGFAGVAAVGVGTVVGGIAIGKALSGDNGAGAEAANAHAMFGDAGLNGMEPKKTDEQLREEDDQTTYDWQNKAAEKLKLEEQQKQQYEQMQEQMQKFKDTVSNAGAGTKAASDKVAQAAEKEVDSRVSWVENMRLLGEQNFPYQYSDYTGNPEDWGTNCALAISKAMEGTVYGGQNGSPLTSVDQFMEMARQLGQLHVAGTYEPKPGDIIVSNYSATTGHVGMVTEKGGVIQNGSHGGANGTGGIEESGDINGSGTPQYIISSSELLGKNSHNASLTVSDLAKTRMNAIKDIKDMTKSLANEIRDMGTETEVGRLMNETADKVAEIQAEVTKGKAQGVNTKNLETQATKYIDAMKDKVIKAQREQDDETYQLQLDHISRMTDLGKGYTADMNKQLSQRLNDYKTWLESQMAAEKVSYEERMKLESQLADVMKKQNDINATSLSTAWAVAGDRIKNTTTDYADIMTSTVDNINSAILGSTQNLIGSEESLGDRMISIIENIGNSVINMIMEIAVKQTILQPLQNTLGSYLGGLGGGLSLSNIGSATTGSSFWGTIGSSISGGDMVPLFASGGTANGLAIVGEKGPELIDTEHAMRVYSNDDLRGALNGGRQSRSGNLTMNVYTNDAGSFKQSRSQIAAQAAGLMRRGSAYA